MTHSVLPHGAQFRSPGNSFCYQVLGPCCKLFDREELPWPCCSLAWRGRQPSWNRVGRRFVPDLTASRCPAYSVIGSDSWGDSWAEVLVLYQQRLSPELRQAWYTKVPNGHPCPIFNVE